MSQRDLTAELRGARITAPPELRQRVRLIAATDTTPTRRFTWRRALVVALPVAAAIAASIVFTRPSNHNAVEPVTLQSQSGAHGEAVPRPGKTFTAPPSAVAAAPPR